MTKFSISITCLKHNKTLEIHKNCIFDENQQLIAVQIPIAEFKQIEEFLENYGLAKLMDETRAEENFTKNEALKFYK